MDGTELRDRGRRAFDRGEWPEACERLRAAAVGGPLLEPEDLERLAVASYLTGHDDESTDAWARAHQAWLDQGAHEDAVRCAFWAGFGLVQRGEMAHGGGWLARAGTLVDQHGLDCVERGYLLLPQALLAMAGGDLDAALGRFREAAELAQRFGDRDLAALGALGRGEALLRSGRASDGMDLFDEAMVSVTAGETSPVVSGVVYCAVIDACQEAFDLRRAREWTAALDRWCAAQPGLVPYRGACLVHRAQILQVGGEWGQAMTEARRACERLADPPHPAIGMAHYELGELHRLQGDLTEAEADYRRAHAAGRNPHPGLALLRLAQGRVDAAVAAIERAIDDARDRLSRTRLLPALVEIMLAATRAADARRAADELAGLAAGARTGVLGAVAAHARGAVLLAEGEPRAALEALHDACWAWQDMTAPYEAAEVRVLIAEACRAVGDVDAAEMELDAARAVFERLGARPALARLDELVARAAGHATPLVTARELEVLRLVAAGRTNREIAQALSISERTVERHLGNVFTKLDVPNRAAATAYAYDHGLV
jgi:DNA-binding CsgD family transcriptional regulator/tetratricopeptide (TPR) repeat protein